MREMPKVWSDRIFLHARIDQQMDGAEWDEIEESQPRHGNAIAGGKKRADIEAPLRINSVHAFDPRGVIEKRVVEGHAPPDHRRIGIVRKKRTPVALVKMHGDSRGDLIDAQYNSNLGRWDVPFIVEVMAHFHRCAAKRGLYRLAWRLSRRIRPDGFRCGCGPVPSASVLPRKLRAGMYR